MILRRNQSRKVGLAVATGATVMPSKLWQCPMISSTSHLLVFGFLVVFFSF